MMLTSRPPCDSPKTNASEQLCGPYDAFRCGKSAALTCRFSTCSRFVDSRKRRVDPPRCVVRARPLALTVSDDETPAIPPDCVTDRYGAAAALPGSARTRVQAAAVARLVMTDAAVTVGSAETSPFARA